MKCPVDGETLVKTERMGIEIDYCPVCRGVWLDRGELDKIIQRTMDEERFRESGQGNHGPRRPQSGAGNHHDAYAPQPGSRRSGRYHESDYPHNDRHHHSHYGGHHKPHKGKYYKPHYKKRKSILGELFEEIFD